MTGVSIDSLTAGNLPKLVTDPYASMKLQWLVPILGGVAPICPTCEGEGCEEGCGTCEMADAGPDSHKVCRSCRGSGLPTQITLTVECDVCWGRGMRYFRDREAFGTWTCLDCTDGQRPVARASLLQVLPIRELEDDEEHVTPHVCRADGILVLSLDGKDDFGITALLPLASWETSKWALLVKDLQAESAV